jgi:hypothetical protein
VGATVLGALLTIRPIARNVGVKMLGAVGVFGLGTVAFGLSTNYWLSLALLAVMGAADMVRSSSGARWSSLTRPTKCAAVWVPYRAWLFRRRTNWARWNRASPPRCWGQPARWCSGDRRHCHYGHLGGGLPQIRRTRSFTTSPNAAQRCMTMTILIPHTYHDGETVLTGHLGRPAGTPRGLIIVYPNIANMTPSVRARAEQLTAEGFLVLVADFYGQPVADFASSHPMGAALRADVNIYRARVRAALAAGRALEAPKG